MFLQFLCSGRILVKCISKHDMILSSIIFGVINLYQVNVMLDSYILGGSGLLPLEANFGYFIFT